MGEGANRAEIPMTYVSRDDIIDIIIIMTKIWLEWPREASNVV